MFELNVELGSTGLLPIRKHLKFGDCSIFDVNIETADDMPFELPMQQYLEEMLIGMHGSPHKEEAAATAKVRAHWQRLKSVLGTEAVQDACHALFGIALGIVIKHASDDAIAEFRWRLAKAWALVVQAVKKKAAQSAGIGGRECDIQDELLRALPVVFVQCIYRLMIDAFPEDRAQLTHHSDELLEKLTHVVTYEVYGFKLNPETWKKERRQVFQKVVIDAPYTNQQDSLKSQMRQEFLQKRSKDAPPLTFGRQDSMPLEELQLEHLLYNRSLARQKARSVPGAASEVPQDLSVDRYATISEVGQRLYNKQVQDLDPENANIIVSPVRIGTAKAERPDSGGATGDAEVPADFRAKRKAAAQAAKKSREEILQSRILDDALPPNLCTKNIDTNWVSPILDRLVPVQRHRQGLQKRSCDSRHLKMELPPMAHLYQSQSEPSLRGTHSSAHSSTFKLPKIGGQHGGSGHHDFNDTAGMDAAPMKKSHGIRTQIVMEPPARLANSVVLHRLEDHIGHFHQKSFGNYAKEFDISSGQKKHRMDPTSMRNAEDAYVSSLHDLVGPAGQSALKLYDSPERTFKRKMKALMKG